MNNSLAPASPPPNADIREMGYLYGDGHTWGLGGRRLHPKLRVSAAVWNWTPEVWIFSDLPEVVKTRQFFFKTEAQAIRAVEVLSAHLAKKLDNWSYRGV
jgi:hypothetical protein